jgi:tetratricopeptide (TPR) repeat protein
LRNLLGLSYQGLGKFEEAKEIFNEGLKYYPKNESFKNNLAKCYNNLFEYKIAEKLYKEIIEANPNYPAAYLNLGNQKRDLKSIE